MRIKLGVLVTGLGLLVLALPRSRIIRSLPSTTPKDR